MCCVLSILILLILDFEIVVMLILDLRCEVCVLCTHLWNLYAGAVPPLFAAGLCMRGLCPRCLLLDYVCGGCAPAVCCWIMYAGAVPPLLAADATAIVLPCYCYWFFFLLRCYCYCIFFVFSRWSALFFLVQCVVAGLSGLPVIRLFFCGVS